MTKLRWIALGAAAVAAAACAACAPGESGRPAFERRAYTIESGGRVTAGISARYALAGPVPAGVSLDPATGEITYGAEVPDGTQVLLVAYAGDFASEPAVVTLRNIRARPDVRVLNPSAYLKNGDRVLVSVGESGAAVAFSLKDRVPGVSVDYVTGKVGFTAAVADGTAFTVTATARGVSAEKTFIAMTRGFVTAEQTAVIRERGALTPAMFTLDFTENAAAAADGALGLVWHDRLYTEADGVYTYDDGTRTVTIAGEFLAQMLEGENTVYIVTARNPVEATVRVATRFIATAEDLAAINDSAETLRGYFIQVEDIDLGVYLKNSAEGWQPIGSYRDVLDGTATELAFKGVYDGNGHAVSGLWMDRQFTVGGFNAGLFGYADTASEIRNLTVRSAKTLSVCSYSGGIAGVNAGIMENCLAEVDISSATGENVYTKTGGLAGRNAGTIRNCIALGSVAADEFAGALVGSNEGVLTGCYAVASAGAAALVGDGLAASESELFASLDALRAFDFTGRLGAAWTVAAGRTPALREITPEQCVRKLEITTGQTTIVRGASRRVTTAIYPTSFAERYRDRIEYTVSGDCVMEGDVLRTAGSTANEVVVRATLVLPYGVLTAEKTFIIV